MYAHDLPKESYAPPHDGTPPPEYVPPTPAPTLTGQQNATAPAQESWGDMGWRYLSNAMKSGATSAVLGTAIAGGVTLATGGLGALALPALATAGGLGFLGGAAGSVTKDGLTDAGAPPVVANLASAGVNALTTGGAGAFMGGSGMTGAGMEALKAGGKAVASSGAAMGTETLLSQNEYTKDIAPIVGAGVSALVDGKANGMTKGGALGLAGLRAGKTAVQQVLPEDANPLVRGAVDVIGGVAEGVHSAQQRKAKDTAPVDDGDETTTKPEEKKATAEKPAEKPAETVEKKVETIAEKPPEAKAEAQPEPKPADTTPDAPAKKKGISLGFKNGKVVISRDSTEADGTERHSEIGYGFGKGLHAETSTENSATETTTKKGIMVGGGQGVLAEQSTNVAGHDETSTFSATLKDGIEKTRAVTGVKGDTQIDTTTLLGEEGAYVKSSSTGSETAEIKSRTDALLAKDAVAKRTDEHIHAQGYDATETSVLQHATTQNSDGSKTFDGSLLAGKQTSQDLAGHTHIDEAKLAPVSLTKGNGKVSADVALAQASAEDRSATGESVKHTVKLLPAHVAASVAQDAKGTTTYGGEANAAVASIGRSTVDAQGTKRDITAKLLDHNAKGELKVGGDDDTTKVSASGKASQALASVEGSEEQEDGEKKKGRIALGERAVEGKGSYASGPGGDHLSAEGALTQTLLSGEGSQQSASGEELKDNFAIGEKRLGGKLSADDDLTGLRVSAEGGQSSTLAKGGVDYKSEDGWKAGAKLKVGESSKTAQAALDVNPVTGPKASATVTDKKTRAGLTVTGETPRANLGPVELYGGGEGTIEHSTEKKVGFDTQKGPIKSARSGLKVDGKGKVAVASSDTHRDLAKLSLGKTGLSPELTEDGRRAAAEVLGQQFTE